MLGKLQRELIIAFYPDWHVFMFFEIVQVYMCLASGTVYKGHLQNEFMSDWKLSGNIQKVENLSVLSPGFSSC